MKRARIRSIYIGIIMTLILGMGISHRAYAITNTDEGYSEERGIVCVRLIYTDSLNQEYVLKKGTGFFVGNGANQEYILTTKSIVSLTPEEQQIYAEQFGIEYQEVAKALSVDATIDGNININLEVKYADSQNLDFAILSPHTSLGNITNLRLAEESEEPQKEMNVYTLGFTDLAGEDTTIIKREGTVLQEVEIQGYSYYQQDIAMNANSMGEPLLNEEGEVIGINAIASDGVIYSLEGKEIITLLNALGYEYSEPYVTDIEGLQTAIQRYESVSFDGYTDESIEACREAYEQAVNRLTQAEEDTEAGTNTKTSQMDIDKAADRLNDSIDQLEVKEMPLKTAIIIMIVGGVLLIGAAVAITLLAVRIRLLKKELKETRESNLTPQDLLQMGGRITPTGSGGQKKSMPINRSLSEISTASEKLAVSGSSYMGQPNMNVGVGNNYPAETSVLNVVSMQDINTVDNTLYKCPTLIRKKTGEVIQITKSSFVLGKAGDQVDFYVGGNTNISRRHACIKKMPDGYYIQDLNSTNGTFVNQCKVSWNRDMKLQPGDVITLGDDEFEFRA